MLDVTDYAFGAMCFSFGVVVGILMGLLLGDMVHIAFGIMLTAAGWRLMRITERKHA